MLLGTTRRGRAPRPEDFGRYDPTTHTLLIDQVAPGIPKDPGYGSQRSFHHNPPGQPAEPFALRVGERGRLHAVLDSHDEYILGRAHQAGVPMRESSLESHEHHKGHVNRPENFGRYDPISSSLAFKKPDGSEHTVRVGDKGRLRSVLESGAIDERSAREIGLPVPETYKGKAQHPGDPGHFNPLTHKYSQDSTPRDFSKYTAGRRTNSTMTATSTVLSPRLNPLTQLPDPLNSTPASMRVYDSRVMHPRDFNVVMRSPHISHGFHSADMSCRRSAVPPVGPPPWDSSPRPGMR